VEQYIQKLFLFVGGTLALGTIYIAFGITDKRLLQEARNIYGAYHQEKE